MVVRLKTKVKFEPKKVTNAVDRANKKNLFKAGGAIRTTSRRLLKRHKKTLVPKVIDGRLVNVRQPSDPGQPPRTTGALKDAIRFEVAKDSDNVVVGPSGDDIANVGNPHEFGGTFRGRNYPKRPFMGPAFDKVKTSLPKLWARSIKS